MLDIIKTRDVVTQGLFTLVHGQPGSGKTSLIKTIPDVENTTLVVSAEGGTLPLRDLDIDMVEVTKYTDMDKVLTFLAKDTKYKWVVIDSLTEIADQCLASESHRGGRLIKPGWDEYFWFNAKLEELIRTLRDMRGLHVVLTCLSAFDVDDHRGRLAPIIPARKLRAKLPQYFDLVLYLNVTQEGKREFITDCGPHAEAKDRSGALDNPEVADLGVIVKKIYGDKEPERKVTPDKAKEELLEKIATGEGMVAKKLGKKIEELRELLWGHDCTPEEATKDQLRHYREELLKEHKKASDND